MSSPPDQASNSRAEIDSLSADILALLAKVTDRFDAGEEEWEWIAHQSDNPRVVALLQDVTILAMRVLDAIGRLEPVNGITISGQFRIPKGTVSKITRRLIAQHLISTEARPHNRKEVLFRLTPLGRELFDVHRAFDERMSRGFTRFLGRYSAEELQVLVRVLQDVTDTSFVTLGLPEPADQGSDARST